MLVHLALAALYLLLAWYPRALAPGRSIAPRERFGLALAIVVHGALIGSDMFGTAELRFGFGYAISSTLWLAVMIVWLQGFPRAGARAAAGRPAAGRVRRHASRCCFRGRRSPPRAISPALRLHLLVAMVAYSL